ncbi:MAG: glycosyltransferase family 4 protein [bacterium]
MKIVFVNTLFPPHDIGGAEQSVRLLGKELIDRGNQVDVITLSPDNEYSQENKDGLNVHYLPLKNLYWPFTDYGHSRWLKPVWNLVDWYNPMMASRVGEILDDVQPDFMHTHNLYGFSTSVWAEAEDRSISVIHTLRDYYLNCLYGTLYRSGDTCEEQCTDCRLWTSHRRSGSSSVQAVTGISQFILGNHVDNGFFEGTSTRSVIYNPLPPDFLRESPPDLQERSGEPFRVGFLGRLDRSKGIEFFLREADNSNPDKFRFHVAGTGVKSYEHQLRQKYENEHIEFHGYQQAREFLDRVDVLVVPSRWPEPMGRVVIEAFARGTPVIASRNGGLPELIDEGENGYLLDSFKKEQLQEYLSKITSNSNTYQEMCQYALKSARQFTVDKITDHYMSLYNEL